MSQSPVGISAFDDTDRTITVVFGDGKRVEYFVGDKYWYLRNVLHVWYENGWHNHIVSKLTEAATEIYIDGKRQHKQDKEPTTMVDFKDKPSEEYSYTVIATTAKSVSYSGGRKWFKTPEDATGFAGEVFEEEKNSNRGSFDLAIVQCIDVVRPKPTVQLISTFNRNLPKAINANKDTAA